MEEVKVPGVGCCDGEGGEEGDEGRFCEEYCE